MKRTVITQLVVLMLFFSCEEEVNKPVFMTLDVSELSTEGVTLNGKFNISGDQEITGYGFAWSNHAYPGTGESDSTFLFHGNPPVGNFQHRVTDGLLVTTDYFVRSFIKANSQIIYANTIEFTALGSATPVILDFSPKSGGSLDKITITGQHLGTSLSTTSVSIGQTICKVLSASSKKIIFEIPVDYTTGVYPMTFTAADKSVLTTQPFTLSGPVIQSISPSNGPSGTVVVISGTGFSTTPTSNVVYFGDKKATVTSATDTQIQVVAPVSPEAGEKVVSVEINHGKSFSPTPFTLIGPVITSFTPASGPVGTHITINGTGFSPILSENEVQLNHLNSVYVTLLTATPNQLVVEVGPVYYSGNESQLVASLSVVTRSIYAFSPDLFTVEGPVITGVTPAAQYEGRNITISGKNFDPNGLTRVYFSNQEGTVISSTATSLTVKVPFGDTWFGGPALPPTCQLSIQVGYFHCYSADKYTILSPWEKLADLPGGARSGVTTFTIGSYSYMAMGINAGDHRDVWRFDSSNNSWQRMNDFPGQSRAFAFSFVINGKAYVGGGGHYGYTSYDLISSLFDLWEYNPAGDSWVQKQSFPTLGSQRFPATSIGDYGYFGFVNNLYKYSPATDQWTVTLTSVSFKEGGVAGTIGDKGYFGLGINEPNLWEFDPATDSWTQLAPSPLVLPPAWGRLTSFTVNNSLYVSSAHKFVKFDATSNAWTQLPAFPVELGEKAAFGSNNSGYMVGGLNGYPFPTFYRFDPNY